MARPGFIQAPDADGPALSSTEKEGTNVKLKAVRCLGGTCLLVRVQQLVSDEERYAGTFNPLDPHKNTTQWIEDDRYLPTV